MLDQPPHTAPIIVDNPQAGEPGYRSQPTFFEKCAQLREALSTVACVNMELQKAAPPFGGLNATPASGLARILVSPGPIYDLEGRRPDFWRAARGLFAAGFRPGDIVLNCYSYHLTPAGTMFETGLHRLGCAVIPGGVGQTEMQARVIADLKPSGYVGTPSFLKLILEKCEELGTDASSLRRALVSGEAFLPPVREFVRARGIDAYQAYGTADLGIIAYETSARDGLVVDEEVIVEIVRPFLSYDPAGSWGNRLSMLTAAPDGPGVGTRVRVVTVREILQRRAPHTVKCNAEGAEFTLVPQLFDLGLFPRQFILFLHPESGPVASLLDRLRTVGYQIEDAATPPTGHSFHCLRP